MTAEDINDTIHIIVDYRVGICPFSFNKCDVTDTLLPHGAAEVRFHSSQRNECSQPRPQAGWNARFSEQNVGRYHSMDMYHVRKH